MFSPKHPRACALAANPQLLEDITFFPLDESLYHTSHSDFPIDLTDILHFPQLNFIPPQGEHLACVEKPCPNITRVQDEPRKTGVIPGFEEVGFR